MSFDCATTLPQRKERTKQSSLTGRVCCTGPSAPYISSAQGPRVGSPPRWPGTGLCSPEEGPGSCPVCRGKSAASPPTSWARREVAATATAGLSAKRRETDPSTTSWPTVNTPGGEGVLPFSTPLSPGEWTGRRDVDREQSTSQQSRTLHHQSNHTYRSIRSRRQAGRPAGCAAPAYWRCSSSGTSCTSRGPGDPSAPPPSSSWTSGSRARRRRPTRIPLRRWTRRLPRPSRTAFGTCRPRALAATPRERKRMVIDPTRRLKTGSLYSTWVDFVTGWS